MNGQRSPQAQFIVSLISDISYMQIALSQLANPSWWERPWYYFGFGAKAEMHRLAKEALEMIQDRRFYREHGYWPENYCKPYPELPIVPKRFEQFYNEISESK